MENQPVFEFSASFKQELESAADRMMETGEARMEISNGDGQVLVLLSEASDKGDRSVFLASFEREGKKFVVCAK